MKPLQCYFWVKILQIALSAGVKKGVGGGGSKKKIAMRTSPGPLLS